MLYCNLNLCKEKNLLDECLENYIQHISHSLEDTKVTCAPRFHNEKLGSWIFTSFLQI